MVGQRAYSLSPWGPLTFAGLARGYNAWKGDAGTQVDTVQLPTILLLGPQLITL